MGTGEGEGLAGEGRHERKRKISEIMTIANTVFSICITVRCFRLNGSKYHVYLLYRVYKRVYSIDTDEPQNLKEHKIANKKKSKAMTKKWAHNEDKLASGPHRCAIELVGCGHQRRPEVEVTDKPRFSHGLRFRI
jgi:hypothetical protein